MMESAFKMMNCAQGGSINRFLASTYGLNGATRAEAGQIDSIVEAIGELKKAFQGAEDKDKFFDDETACDFAGVADRDARPARAMKWYAGRLNNIVGDGGCAVGGKISLADVMIYACFKVIKDNSPNLYKTDDFCTGNDEFCIQNDGFCRRTRRRRSPRRWPTPVAIRSEATRRRPRRCSLPTRSSRQSAQRLRRTKASRSTSSRAARRASKEPA